MKRITGVLISACMVAGNVTLIAESASAEKSIKAGKGISKAGRTLPSTLNTILSGVGTPSASFGHDGDFYIDRKSWQFFGPKTKGRWPLPVLLVGPTGSQGAAGAVGPVGAQGKSGVKGEGGSSGAVGSATITAGSAGPIGPSGPAGSPGSLGASGPMGVAGSTGPSGSSGPAGVTGATGSSGLPGPTGATGATGVQGIQGDIGLTGAMGSTGSVGPLGPVGPTGTTGSMGATGTTGSVGPRGPSTVSSIQIPSFLLASTAPNSDAPSSTFGNIVSNSNYHFILILHGKGAIPATKSFAISVAGTASVIITSDSSVNESIYYDKSAVASKHEYTFRAFGTASGGVDGGSLFVTVTDGSGITGTYPMTLTGTCTLQQVGAIS